MLTILSVAIGIILVLLLMSILSSTVHDIISSMLSLRGRHLRKTLTDMLGEQTENFFSHPFFRQLIYADKNKNLVKPYSLPDWIDKETFSAILHDVLQDSGDGNNLAEKINKISDPNLKRLLEYLVRESDGTIGGLKAKLENWFEQVMERSSAFFARATKWRLFVIGLVMAALLNADTIHIYQALSTNPELREKIVQVADKLAAADTIPAIARDSSIKQTVANAQSFLSSQLGGLESPLGLGWNEPDDKKSLPDWLVKLAGFLLTGIAVTFGASFWFDLLKKMLALRNSAGGGSGGGASDNSGTSSSRGASGPPQNIDAQPIGTVSDSDKSKQ